MGRDRGYFMRGNSKYDSPNGIESRVTSGLPKASVAVTGSWEGRGRVNGGDIGRSNHWGDRTRHGSVV